MSSMGSTVENDSKSFNQRTEDETEFKMKLPRFDPPVYRQRYQVVEEMVKKFKVKTVIDFGCAEGKLMKYLMSHTSVEELIGIDIDGDLLEQNKFRFQPLLADYLHRRPRPLKVSTYKGSIAEVDKRFCDCDLMACIEIIEHLEPAVLEAMPAAVFGCLSPKVVIVTTPNVEFNVQFPDLQGFRHWDHKFEWTRSQFEDWARTQATKYNYIVTFRGIGAGAEGTEHLGCVSQMALFEKENCFDTERLSSMGESYIQIMEVEHPYQRCVVSDEEKVLLEVKYLLWVLSNPDLAAESESTADGEYPAADGLFSLDRLMEFPSLRKLSGTKEVLRSVVKASQSFNLNDEESAIMWCRPESWSSNECDDEVEWDTEDQSTAEQTDTYTENKECETESWDLDIPCHVWSGEATAESKDEEEAKRSERWENPESEDESLNGETGDDHQDVFGRTCSIAADSGDDFFVDEQCDDDGVAWIETTDEDSKSSEIT